MSKVQYQQEFKRYLTFFNLYIYGIVFMIPFAPVTLYGYVVESSRGMVSLAYLISMIGMLFTALSYASLSKVFPVAGSIYSYAQRGINEDIGFMAGWIILLYYVFAPAIMCLSSSIAIQNMLPQIPAYVWVCSFVIINTVINILGINITAKAYSLVAVIEILVMVFFLGITFWSISNGINGANFSLKPLFDPQSFNFTAIMAASSISCMCFLGFESISTLAEETKGGGDIIGKAMIYSLITMGLVFIILTWLAALIYPDFHTFRNLDIAFYQITEIIGGVKLRYLINVTFILASIAASLLAQAAMARILYSMARDGMLPSILAKVHPKFRTPYASILLVAAISFIITIFFSHKALELSTLIIFGALSAFMLIHFSVFSYFILKRKSQDYLRHLVVPVVGLIIISYLWLSQNYMVKKQGLIWIGIGIIYLTSYKLVKRFINKN